MVDSSPSLFDAIEPSSRSSGFESLEDAWDAYAVNRARGASPFVAAVAVAARADRLGHAFAVGYPAALERLIPGVALPPALCVTEDGGNGPRAILTTLEPTSSGYRLDGTKSFVTFGSLAEELVVAARAGIRPDGRPEIAVVRIPASRKGITVEELPPTSFVPDVPHARLGLDHVKVRDDERLPGDGYLGYVKPFRTIEDIHVVGAAVAYALGFARRVGGSPALVARLAADLAALDRLHDAAPLNSAVHVVLHGCYSGAVDTLRGSEFNQVLREAAPEERERWRRDEALLSVAQKAREVRFEAAQRVLAAQE